MIRSGVFGVDHIVIELHKLQRAAIVQTPPMRKAGLASIEFTVASRKVKVPFLPVETARRAVDHGLYQTESSTRSWM